MPLGRPKMRSKFSRQSRVNSRVWCASWGSSPSTPSSSRSAPGLGVRLSHHCSRVGAQLGRQQPCLGVVQVGGRDHQVGVDQAAIGQTDAGGHRILRLDAQDLGAGLDRDAAGACEPLDRADDR